MLLFVLISGLADTEAFDLSLPLWAVLLICAIVYGTMPNILQAVPPVQSSAVTARQVLNSGGAGV